MSYKEAFAYGCSDAMNHRNYADALQCKRHLKEFRASYDKGWHSTRIILHKRKL